MKLTPQDVNHLRGALLLLLGCLLVAAAAVWGSLVLEKQTTAAHQAALAAQQSADNTLARARREEQQLREMINRFQVLTARGIIGPEQRLDWVEILGRIKGARRIPRIDYDFAPQRPVTADILPSDKVPGFRFMASQMRLSMRLLHEGDLLGFIDDLRRTAPALIQIRSCSIDRISPNTVERPADNLLTSECILEWITVKEEK
jgi:hypothetical protein